MKKCFSIVLTVLMAVIAFTAFSSVNAVSVESNQSVHTNQTADLGIPPLDFGDSNDYDSGGSDWGGSSDWGDSSDWDSSDYSSSESSGEGLGFGGMLVVFLVVIGIVVYSMIRSEKDSKRTTTTVGRSQTIQQSAGRNITLPDRTAQISDLIKQNDPNFSAEDFLSFSRYVYVTIQDAWSKRDLSPVRIYLHDNLYNQTQKQIDRKIANGVINKIENVAVSTAYLTAYRRDKEFEYVTVYLNAVLQTMR